jgi:hypothetical protein
MPALITEYEFTELPLVVENEFHAGFINGSAEILIDNDGEWSVGKIYLDGYAKGACKPVELKWNRVTPFEQKLHFHIIDCLESERLPFKSHIETRIQEAIEGELINRQAAE